MVIIFEIHLGWLPSAGFVSPLDDFTGFLRRAILPVVSLSIPFLAVIMRLTRSSVLEQLRLDYVLAARAKGLKESTVLIKHILRNALIPIITVASMQVGRMIGGSLLVETIYNWPGISSFLINAARVRDYPVVQGTMLAVSVIFLAINVIVDISYAFIDPQIKYEQS